MKLINYLIGGGLVAVLVAGAVLAVNMNSTITGDRATDKACMALAQHFLREGEHPDETAVMRQLSPERMRELVESVTEHTADSSFPAVREAGEKLAAAGTVPTGLFGVLGVMTATTEVIGACRDAGWTPQAAGLVDGIGQ